jgi:S-DNA-T family DNA segregation ATPase FtsK/SpoIIIE
MRIFFTIIDDWKAQRRDVLVEAEADVTVAALVDALDVQAGAAGTPQPWWDGDRLLAADHPAGLEIKDGAVLARRPSGGNDRLILPVGELRAVAGPHAGTRWPLPEGRHLVGRSDEATVNLVTDPRVSRQHVMLTITPGGLTWQDLGSSAGTVLDGAPATDGNLRSGAMLQVGDTVLTWSPIDEDRAVVVPDGQGGLLFNRPPRMLTSLPISTVRYPGPAPVRTGMNFPLLASIAPVILGVVMALALRNPEFLLFTALAPVIAVSNYITQRRSGAKSHRERIKAHTAATERADLDLSAAVAGETAQRRRAFPDPAALAAVADGPHGTLWERRRSDDDFLVLRLGLADLPASFAVDGRAPSSEHDLHADASPSLHRVPAVVHLAQDGVLGIAGPRQACEALARTLVVETAVLHPPDDVILTILTGPHQEASWGWARWLPHVRDRETRTAARIGTTDAAVSRLAGELASMVDERRVARQDPLALPPRAHVVVLDGSYRLGGIPALTKVLRDGPPVGVYCICVDDAERLLPEECHAVAVFDAERPTRVGLRTGRGSRVTQVLADLTGPDWAEKIARALAPLRLNRRAEAAAAIPDTVRLLDQLLLEPPEPARIVAGWEREERSTQALVGESATGPMVVDLARDGPHGLVAGTTGSGKSELLQSLIASLAVVNRPDLMNFVLVDYKGGSAFKDCARLPHTVGMVTDLDGHLTERALASIAAELHRRELLLAAVGAKDIEGYWRASAAEKETLSRLLIVIDEFAALVEELPTFVDGLVDLARRGRSLGIHLILATQRPSGVVSAAIKTNTNLRIAMRVTDAADSVDVIDSPLAARISKSTPGRGYVRVGHEHLTEFQAGRIGGRRPLQGAAGLVVHDVGWPALATPLPDRERPLLAEEETDLAALVAAIQTANDHMGLPAPASPWLEPLPALAVLDPATLVDQRAGAGSVLRAPFGWEDHPERQARLIAYVDLERDGHLLAVGDPGTGRSTLLRTLAASMAARVSLRDLHFFGIDCGNGALLPLEELPHCGAVVTRREPDRVDRLLTKLQDEVVRRQQLMAQKGFSTIADQRAASTPEERLPYLVVLIDRWEGFTAEFESLDAGRLVAAIQQLMREGPGVGLRVIVTGDRSATTPRFSSLVERIMMMRLNDRNTYAVVGLNPRHLPDEFPPGRGFDARSKTEIQVALLDADPSGPAQVAALRRLAEAVTRREAGVPDSARPEPIAALPAHVALSGVLPPHRTTAAQPIGLVGVGGDRLTPQTVDLAASGPGFVISGPPRSGRSNALVVMARSLARQGCIVVAVTARPSPLSDLAGTEGVAAVLDGRAVAPADLESLLGMIEGPTVVAIDDAELLSDAPIGEPLVNYCRKARDQHNSLIIAGTTGDLGAFRGFIPEVRKSKSGLLLCPGAPAEGELLGARLPRTAVFSGPPGRGVLVTGWALTLVQVPFDDCAADSAQISPH